MNSKDLVDDRLTDLSDRTGSHDSRPNFRLVQFPIDRFEIVVRLSESNQFMGIEEIRVNKEFMEFAKKSPRGYHDVDDYYRE